MNEPSSEPTESAALLAIREELDCALRLDANVLMTGAVGIGQEAIARLIHQGSTRRASAFVAVDCAASAAVLEAALFGGAGVNSAIAAAAGGTVFLHNAAEMSRSTQTRLSTFLETGEIASTHRHGAHAGIDVRVITATDINLYDEVTAGRFGEELYYRLNLIQIMIPPLRARTDDLRQLLSEFMRSFGEARNIPGSQLSTVSFRTLGA